MPRGDRRGPRGMGPQTGRGFGFCAGYDGPGFQTGAPMGGRGQGFGPGYGGQGRGFRSGNGYGRGNRHGVGFGFGRGWDHREQFDTEIPVAAEPSLVSEISLLRDEMKQMETRLAELTKLVEDK